MAERPKILVEKLVLEMEDEHADNQGNKDNHLDIDDIKEAKDMACNTVANGESENTSLDCRVSEAYAPQDHSLWDQRSPVGCPREGARILHKEGILTAVVAVKPTRAWVQGVKSFVSSN